MNFVFGMPAGTGYTASHDSTTACTARVLLLPLKLATACTSMNCGQLVSSFGLVNYQVLDRCGLNSALQLPHLPSLTGLSLVRNEIQALDPLLVRQRQ